MVKTGGSVESTLTASRETEQGLLACFRLGPFEHRGLGFSPSWASTLGTGYWYRYHLTLDFPAGFAYLRKGKHFDEPERGDRSGLFLHRIDGRTLVERVSPDSPGAKAGIRVGDALVRVDALAADRARLFVLRRRFGSPGATVPVTLKRDGKLIKVTVRLGP
jgi:membrane-associated protease RseP (regulator of RpoE activity)